MIGGLGALMSLIFLGPRKERFNPKFAHTFEPSN